MKILFVGGTFDKCGGKESGIIRKITEHIKSNFHKYENMNVINGGNMEQLMFIGNDIKNIDILFWFPNIDNSENKILNHLKTINPKLYLIQSKVNNGRYSVVDLIARALKSKANLLVEINQNIQTENDKLGYIPNLKKEETSKEFLLTIHDPLANIYYEGTDYKDFTNAMIERLDEIRIMTRKGSKSIGEKDINKVPNEKEFFNIVSSYGNKFHELTHAINQERYLGNCSFRTYDFRCTFGFPSFKDKEGVIYVSKRNVDKRDISSKIFVPVVNNKDKIEYLGENPPSVDTPIQVELYKYFKNINYMIHSHVYIKDAKFTNKIIPCGSLEEIKEIVDLYKNDLLENFYAINLKGHGSIVMSNNTEKLKKIKYVTRNFPEIQFKQKYTRGDLPEFIKELFEVDKK